MVYQNWKICAQALYKRRFNIQPISDLVMVLEEHFRDTQSPEAGILSTWRWNPIIKFLEQFQRNFNFDRFFWFINIEICLKNLQNLLYKKFNKQLFGDIIKILWWTLFSSVVVILYTLYWQTKWPKINNWMVSAINISYPKSTSQIPFFKAPLIYAKLVTCPKTRSFTIHSG